MLKEYKLLPYTDYEKINHILPVLAKLTSNGKNLWYYAVNHTFDPKDSLFPKIKKVIKEYKPDLIVLEGGTVINSGHSRRKEYFEKILNKTEEQNIISRGEFSFTLQQALINQIEVFCPEPEFIEIINFQTKKFESEDIFLNEIIKIAVEFYSMNLDATKCSIIDYLNEEIIYQKEKLENLREWKDFNFDWSNFLKLFQERLKLDFLSTPSQIILELNDPIPWSTKQHKWTVNNDVSQSECNFRDNYILNQIENKLKKYSQILVVYGGSHYYAQKKALKKLLV